MLMGGQLPPGEALVSAVPHEGARRPAPSAMPVGASNRATARAAPARVLALIRAEVRRWGRRAVWADARGGASGERGRGDRRSRNAAALDAGGGAVESARGNGARIGGGGNGKRISASSCSSMAVFIRGSKRAARSSCLLTLVDDATGREPGALRRRRKRSGRRSASCARGSIGTAFRRRSIPTGKTSMCGCRMPRNARPAPSR